MARAAAIDAGAAEPEMGGETSLFLAAGCCRPACRACSWPSTSRPVLALWRTEATSCRRHHSFSRGSLPFVIMASVVGPCSRAAPDPTCRMTFLMSGGGLSHVDVNTSLRCISVLFPFARCRA